MGKICVQIEGGPSKEQTTVVETKSETFMEKEETLTVISTSVEIQADKSGTKSDNFLEKEEAIIKSSTSVESQAGNNSDDHSSFPDKHCSTKDTTQMMGAPGFDNKDLSESKPEDEVSVEDKDKKEVDELGEFEEVGITDCDGNVSYTDKISREKYLRELSEQNKKELAAQKV